MANLIVKHVVDFDSFGIVSKTILDLAKVLYSPVGRRIWAERLQGW
jgi:hypothetical protein